MTIRPPHDKIGRGIHVEDGLAVFLRDDGVISSIFEL
jgi:hypothetical protein